MQEKQIETQVVTLVTKAKSYVKPVLYIIGALILLYGLIYLFTKKEQMPAELRATIDSLNKVNIQLVEKQRQLDSAIKNFEIKVQQVDVKINSIKERTTIIREYYHELIQSADKYTPSQVESFFKTRYNY